ncbi:hypothetical protein BGZ70_005594, partial [Mortierella alpina]
MSHLAGLARTNTTDRKNEPSCSSAAANPTTATPASTPGNAPSLSALASGAQARPRQSLAGLGRLGANGSSSSSSSSRSDNGVSAGAHSPSLSGLASARKDGHDRPSLQDLAKGSSSGLAGSRAGSRIERVSSRPSLSSLARSQNTQESTPNAEAAPPTTRTSLSQLASISAGANGSTSSLGQLASNQNMSPRRSLASLVNATPNKAPALSSTSLLSKNTAPTATTLEEASIGSTLAASPTLSSLASSSLQRRAPLDSLVSRRQPANDNGFHRSKEQEPTTAYTPASSSVTASNIEPEPLLSSSTATTRFQLHMHEADAAIASNSTWEMDAAPAYSSLIAPPSHFAVSIFERLDPVPSPIALTTASILEAGTGLSAAAKSCSSTGAVTPARIFRFDVPSPDDVVFKAQGQRPAVSSLLSRDNLGT